MRYTVLKSFHTPTHRFHEGMELDDDELDGVLLASDWADRGHLAVADAQDLDSLRAEAASLGIDFDRRWGVKRLRDAIEAEKAEAAAAAAAAPPAPPAEPSE